jgi:hypothetical protein
MNKINIKMVVASYYPGTKPSKSARKPYKIGKAELNRLICWEIIRNRLRVRRGIRGILGSRRMKVRKT